MRECCPGEELQQFTQDHFVSEMRSSLVFQDRFQDHVGKIKAETAAKAGVSLDEVVFVGIHNRRTVSTDRAAIHELFVDLNTFFSSRTTSTL